MSGKRDKKLNNKIYKKSKTNKEKKNISSNYYALENKKNTRIYILIVLLIILLIQFIALGLSQAQKILEINVEVIDSLNDVSKQKIILNAINSSDSGYSIILPEKINNIYVTEYIIETNEVSKGIEKNNETLRETQEVTEATNNANVKVPGDIIYLTEEEVNSRATTFSVMYNFKEIDNGKIKQKIYYQDIYPSDYIESENPDYLSNIVVTGFMPLNLELDIIEDNNIEVVNLLKDELTDENQIEKNIRFDFTLNNEKYDISKLKESLTISLSPVDEKKVYSAYSINKKSEYIGKENVTDALGNPINTYNITEIVGISVNKGILNVNTENLEYLGIISKQSDFVLMERVSPLGAKGMEVPASFDPLTGTNVWDGSVSTYLLGNGTSTEPYLIKSGADLAYLRNQVNSGTNYENSYFQLVNNIDLDNREWEPIGSYTAPFRGNFDGSGKTIKNSTVLASGTISSYDVLSYGFFGSIGGGSSRQTIQNLELDNIKVEIRFYSNTTTSTYDRIFGLNVGTLTGTIFRNCTISNCNVKNMNIYEANSYRIYIRSYRFQYCVGGLVGEAINGAYSVGDPGSSARYSIINSVVSGNILVNNSYARNLVSSAQFTVGGIIGRIRSQPVWPENCLHIGNITSSDAFIGPIFGQLRNNTNVNSTSYFDTLWQGNDSGNLTCTSKYNSTQINGYTFASTQISGTSSSRISTNSNNYGYTQGNNKGIYDSNNPQIMLDLNNAPEAVNVKWTYNPTTGFSLSPRLRSQVTENPEFTYSASIDDLYSAGAYTYQWILNGTTSSNTSSVYVLTEPNFEYDINVEFIGKDTDGYYTVYEFLIPKIYVELTFNIDHNNNTAEGIISGPGMAFTSYADYTFQWYTEDISGYEQTEIVGATDRFITDLDTRYDYKLVCTNTVIPGLSVEGSFAYANRTVVYIKENGGSNYNTGYTPEDPVQTMATAYARLTAGGTRDENVIVVMDSVSNNDIFTGETSTTYMRNVTITGVYKREEYPAILTLHGESTYKYMNGDTTFMYINLDGYGYYSSGWSGYYRNMQLYWYLQGYSLTMGEGVVMTRYATANTNQGLIAGNAPAFHIFACWHRYDKTTLPRNNPKIIIKSGTYGRIVLGGSPGTNAVSNLENYNSRNFIGSPTDMFNIEATIDIQNTTTDYNNYPYDVNLFVGGSAAGNNYFNVTENIKAGKVGRVLRCINW